MEKYIDEYLADRIIRPSSSPVGVFLFFFLGGWQERWDAAPIYRLERL